MKKMSYDTAIARLEEIVHALEDENTPIEEALRLFEEGVGLTKLCQSKLQDIEKKVNVYKVEQEEKEHDA